MSMLSRCTQNLECELILAPRNQDIIVLLIT